jgi:hypothetical protein
VDLPVYGVPMSLAWKKHRMRCVNPGCPKRSWVNEDHRIAAKSCLLTTRAAKWATVQVGAGRTVSEVAAELSCDWHTVNEAVITYGEALLAADRKRLNKTTAIGLDETSFVKRSSRNHTDYATTVADVEVTRAAEFLASPLGQTARFHPQSRSPVQTRICQQTARTPWRLAPLAISSWVLLALRCSPRVRTGMWHRFDSSMDRIPVLRTPMA